MSSSAPWHCPNCKELVSGKFDVCWNCGTDPSGARDPDFRAEVEVPPVATCKECGYPLHGLPTNVCPECGTAFDPREKDTAPTVEPTETPTALRPRCPQCGQGQLEPGVLQSSYRVRFRPDDMKFFSLTVGAEVLAAACTHCGYVQVSVDPKELAALLRKRGA